MTASHQARMTASYRARTIASHRARTIASYPVQMIAPQWARTMALRQPLAVAWLRLTNSGGRAGSRPLAGRLRHTAHTVEKQEGLRKVRTNGQKDSDSARRCDEQPRCHQPSESNRRKGLQNSSGAAAGGRARTRMMTRDVPGVRRAAHESVSHSVRAGASGMMVCLSGVSHWPAIAWRARRCSPKSVKRRRSSRAKRYH